MEMQGKGENMAAALEQFPPHVTMIKYGVFCQGSGSGKVPAMTFYTRFAAEKKCRELNSRETGREWFIRNIEE